MGLIKGIILIILVITLIYLIFFYRRISEMFEDLPSVSSEFNDDYDLLTSCNLGDIALYIWQLNNTKTAYRIGQYVTTSKNKPPNTIPILTTLISGGKFPIKYSKLWSNKDVTLWKPIAPNGYVALTDVFTTDDNIPSFDSIMCIPKDNLYNIQLDKPQLNNKIIDLTPKISLWKHGHYRGFFANDDPLTLS